MTKGLESCAMGKVMASGHGTLGVAELLGAAERNRLTCREGTWVGRLKAPANSYPIHNAEHPTSWGTPFTPRTLSDMNHTFQIWGVGSRPAISTQREHLLHNLRTEVVGCVGC